MNKSGSNAGQEELPESYADLAKRIYDMAAKEGWPQSKVFDLLKNPAKMVRILENVRITNDARSVSFSHFNFSIFVVAFIIDN